jgi:hypothetical protein
MVVIAFLCEASSIAVRTECHTFGKMKEGDLNDESFSGFFQTPQNEFAVTFHPPAPS